jgi:catechol 2,3-dioxygenase-like lactoylglutathione lyase family enzyme
MPTYTYDHIHLRSQDPMETARYFNRMFDAKILESVQSDGQTRVDLDINGLIIFIARAPDDAPTGPAEPYVGLDHFGLRVENLEEAAAQLKERGAEFYSEPRDLRPGLKIAFVLAPGNIRIELLERS